MWIFASVTACQSLLPELLSPIRIAHPRVRISVRTGDAASALALPDDGEAELAVAALPARIPTTLLTRQITRTALPLIQTDPAPPIGQLSAPEQPFVLPRQGAVRTAADQWFKSLRYTPTSPPNPTATKPCSPWSLWATASTSSPASSSSRAASAPGSTKCPPLPAPENSPSACASDAPTCTVPWSPQPGQQHNQSENTDLTRGPLGRFHRPPCRHRRSALGQASVRTVRRAFVQLTSWSSVVSRAAFWWSPGLNIE